MEQTKEKTEADSFVEAVAKAEKLKAELTALNEEHKALISKIVLGGKSEAGTTAEPPKEETAQEYAARILRGR
jgi:hypothetical protein